ncbi:MAG: hypothetical protein U1E03_01685 [Hyphomonadaceae bacterium]
MTSTHPQKSDEAPGTSLKGACHCGACGWTLHGDPGSITACNCSLCVRIGALWAYDFEDERISITGPTSAYARKNKTDPALEIHFCPTCSNVVCWRGLRLEPDGRRRMAVNVRLAPLEGVAHLAIDHFDGADSFNDLPSDSKCVRDLWF